MFVFNTRVLFLLAKFTQFFKKDMGRIMDFVMKDNIDNSDISGLTDTVFAVISTLPEAEQSAYELLAAATGKTVSDIQTMDAYEFIKQFRMFIGSVDWVKLLGESLGLVLVPAKPAEEQPQMV